MPALRVSFFIDGFNVYHSIKAAISDGSITSGKWLDFKALCESYIGLVGSGHTDGAILSKVHYYSALAHHIPAAAHRHRSLIDVLTDQGVDVVLGNFKRKDIRCRAQCQQIFTAHEEKETDLNIGLGLVSAFHTNECDVAVIMSGDTDLLAAIRQAKSLFPNNRLCVAFPYKRFNNHFRSFVDQTIKIPAVRYQQYQLPDPFSLSTGGTISKPPSW
jgi:uncharacterized LabA/DUF88 family protein